MMNHPSDKELRDALLHPEDASNVHDHVEVCLACRVHLARLERASDPQPPTSNTVQRIIEASTVVPGLVDLATLTEGEEPNLGELWRIGRDEALLAWVRKNFGDGVIDVIPAVLDIELADEQTVAVSATQSGFPVDLAVMVALRTHVHRDAFINRVAELDISADVEDLIAATREGRESVAPVGPRIEHDDDDRIEYRQALRDMLSEFSPSAWASQPDSLQAAPSQAISDTSGASSLDVNEIQTAISGRLWTAQCTEVDRTQLPLGPGEVLEALFKVVYLDTAVLVAEVQSLDSALADLPALVAACHRAAESNPDADAVCVAVPSGDWPSLLFSRASMRQALGLPTGVRVAPAPILSGLGLVDTLWKHLEGAAPAWEITESPPRGLGSVDVSAMADRHVRTSIAAIEAQGQRAHQVAKKSSWGSLPDDLGARVARFVVAVTQEIPIEHALAEFDRETPSD